MDPETEPTTPVETAPEGTPTPAPEVDPFDAPETTTFDRGYVERIRGEAAEHRTARKAYDEAFDGYNEEEKQSILQLARMLKTNVEGAFEYLEQSVSEYRTANPKAPPAPEAPAPSADAPLTAADVERLLTERETARAAEKAQQDAIEGVYQSIRDLKVEPDSADGIAIMKYAVDHGTDVVAAHKAVVTDRNQKIIDDFVAAKAKSVNPGSATEGAGGSPSPERKVTGSFKDAMRAATDRMANS